ncbi:SCO2583 family membrane protein [Streptodolium elevatio]
MSGRGEPPEGSRGGGPDGDDEFQAVFDESFVSAAVLHEPSAQERMRTGKGPRQLRRVFGMPAAAFQIGILMLSVVLLLAGALYLGARRGGGTAAPRAASGPAVLVRVSLVPAQGLVLVATGPGGDPFAGSAAAAWSDGRAGIVLPQHGDTAHFSAAQVREALEQMRDFVYGTQLDPEVWGGMRPWSAALRLETDQHAQLTASYDHPVDDDVHSATGWATRFDPAQIAVADTKVRVSAAATVAETDDEELIVTVDGVFVYAVKAAGGDTWSRFVVHRAWEFQVDRHGLRTGTMRVRRIVTIAAPQACTADTAAFFRPVTATTAGAAAPGAVQTATEATTAAATGAGATVEPYDPLVLGTATATTCGVLAVAV